MEFNDASVFSTIAKYFAPTDEQDWSAATGQEAWTLFLDQVRRRVQDGRRFGENSAPVELAHRQRPLQAFLCDNEVRALYAPPSFAEKEAFAAKYLIGGLPVSAMPVESIYVRWTNGRSSGPFSSHEGLYVADSALYMKDLLARLDVELPAPLASYPDHLSVELELVALLLDAGLVPEARSFVAERFDWLTNYRLQLVALGEEALFALALVDVVLAIRASLAEEDHTAR